MPRILSVCLFLGAAGLACSDGSGESCSTECPVYVGSYSEGWYAVCIDPTFDSNLRSRLSCSPE